MKHRSPVVVILLTLLTLGIYGLVWQVQTKNEMNRSYGTRIPTAWLLLVPFIGPLYFMWKWSEGSERATGMTSVVVFVMMVMIPILGIPVMVAKFNEAKPALPTAETVPYPRAA